MKDIYRVMMLLCSVIFVYLACEVFLYGNNGYIIQMLATAAGVVWTCIMSVAESEEKQNQSKEG